MADAILLNLNHLDMKRASCAREIISRVLRHALKWPVAIKIKSPVAGEVAQNKTDGQASAIIEIAETDSK